MSLARGLSADHSSDNNQRLRIRGNSQDQCLSRASAHAASAFVIQIQAIIRHFRRPAVALGVRAIPALLFDGVMPFLALAFGCSALNAIRATATTVTRRPWTSLAQGSRRGAGPRECNTKREVLPANA